MSQAQELAKKAGITSLYYKDWTNSYQTHGDILSPITVVTVTQPLQRDELLDYTKKNQAEELQERFFVRDKEKHAWNRIVNEGTLNPKPQALNHPKPYTLNPKP